MTDRLAHRKSSFPDHKSSPERSATNPTPPATFQGALKRCIEVPLSGLEANTVMKGIGASADAARMQRVVGFYEKLPRGSAPEPKPRGLLQRYQARYMGKNPSAMRTVSMHPCQIRWLSECSNCPRYCRLDAPRLRSELLLPSP